MKFVFITYEFYPFPLALHLMDEGREVLIGVVENYEDIGLGPSKNKEKPEERKMRLSNYDGLIEKDTLKDVFEFLKKVPESEKDDYFFFFDYSDMYKVSEKILDMGFKNGLFPTEFYYEMEKDRQRAKEFVKENYDRVKVAEAHDFKKIEDGIELINSSDDIYVLKSNGNLGKTVVPVGDNANIARMILTNTLQKYRKDYEAQGFMLEKKILNALEVTPVMVFYDGKPVYSLVEFENKEYGAGNIGVQKGGNQALSGRTKLSAEINKIAFPEIIYELAKAQPGLSIFDAGLLYDGKDFWFTEFCAMRYGWDGIFSEIVMRDNGKPFVADYFEDIIKGQNPLKNKYGASLRLFNLEGNPEETENAESGAPMYWDESIENNLFLYRAKEKDGEIVSVGDVDALGVMTAAGNSINSAVEKLYERIDKFYFEKLYYRPKFDFLSTDYGSSILSRMEALKKFL